MYKHTPTNVAADLYPWNSHPPGCLPCIECTLNNKTLPTFLPRTINRFPLSPSSTIFSRFSIVVSMHNTLNYLYKPMRFTCICAIITPMSIISSVCNYYAYENYIAYVQLLRLRALYRLCAIITPTSTNN